MHDSLHAATLGDTNICPTNTDMSSTADLDHDGRAQLLTRRTPTESGVRPSHVPMLVPLPTSNGGQWFKVLAVPLHSWALCMDGLGLMAQSPGRNVRRTQAGFVSSCHPEPDPRMPMPDWAGTRTLWSNPGMFVSNAMVKVKYSVRGTSRVATKVHASL
jgi:hypothetical protein